MDINLGRVRLNIIKSPTKDKTVLLFIPGSSGEVFSEKFDFLKDAVINRGCTYAAAEIWQSLTSLNEMTLEDIGYSMNQIIFHLKSLGYKKIFCVGKSFGGGMILLYPNKEIDHVVLWAPAIGLGDKELSTQNYKKKLKDFPSIFDITVNRTALEKYPSNVVIVHGEKDLIVPVKNSKEICDLLPHGHLEVLSDLGHSPEGDLQKNKLALKTLEFLEFK